MSRCSRWCWISLGVAAAVLAISTGTYLGQETKPAAEKHSAKMLYDSLRDVINNGADLFNNQRDYAGCYRVYQGALLSVKPFLATELQTRVEGALGKTDRMTSMADCAFELRAVIDAIRDDIRGGPPVDGKDKTAKDKVVPKDKNEEKTTLWDRLGGKDNVEKVVEEFLGAAAKDPKVNVSRDGKFELSEIGKEKLKSHLVAFISANTGGPIKYTGKSMKEAHKKMCITEAEFDAAAGHIRKALEKHGAQPPAIRAVMNAVASTRTDVVEECPKKDKKDGVKDAPPKDGGDKEDAGLVSGKVMSKGEPVGLVYLNLVSSTNRRFTTFVNKDGAYAFRTPIPAGTYKVFLETDQDKKATVNIPERFQALDTARLELRVQPGMTKADVMLGD